MPVKFFHDFFSGLHIDIKALRGRWWKVNLQRPPGAGAIIQVAQLPVVNY